MKKLVIIRGIPGSGKSTYANGLIKAYQSDGHTTAHFEADMFFTHEDGSYHWNPKQIGFAHQWCQDQVRESLKNCDVVIVSNTSVQKRDVDTYIKIAQEAGADYEIYHMLGQFQNIHEVPAEVIRKMLDSFEDYPGEICVDPGSKEINLPDIQRVRDVALGDLIGMVRALNEAVKIQHEIIADLATQSSNYNAHVAGLLGRLNKIKYPEPTKLEEKSI